MVNLNPVVKDIIESQYIKYFILVTIRDQLRFTSLPFDITMSDGFVYTSDGGLSGIDPPNISSTVDRSSYKITFIDSNFLLKSYFESGATGDPVSVRLGFYNTLETTIDNVEPGQLFTNIDYTMLIYRGVIDGQSYSIDIQNNEITALIEGSSPMADLDLVKLFYTNKESMRAKNSNDSSFDKVHEGSGSIKLKWGKA
jgi:hypothetical protein